MLNKHRIILALFLIAFTTTGTVYFTTGQLENEFGIVGFLSILVSAVIIKKEMYLEKRHKMKNTWIERIAVIEHEQWITWSKQVAKTETISPTRLKRWKKYWIPYEQLPENVKEQDRKWARKVLEMVESHRK